MIRTGKVYGNLMVDVEATKRQAGRAAKTHRDGGHRLRARRGGAGAGAGGQPLKTAIVMILAGLTADEARTRLQSSNGFISQCTH